MHRHRCDKLTGVSFQYLSVDEAIARRGLRLVVVGQVPSPWGEAAKGIFHVKRIDFAAVRLVYDNEALKAWARELSAPVAIYDDEPPRSGWAEILMLAEQLAPTPALLPLEPEARARALLLADSFCGPNGLGWHRRLQLVHAGLTKVGGFSERVAGYLAQKYGYDPAAVGRNAARVVELLEQFTAVLRAQRDAGRPYYLGETFSAVDIYSATFMALFKPLPAESSAMHLVARAGFEYLDPATAAALDPILLEHRDLVYARHLELPLSL
jgi:glutathione S-transferase